MIDQIEILMDPAADRTADREAESMFRDLADFGVKVGLVRKMRLA